MAKRFVTRKSKTSEPLEREEGMALTSWVRMHYPDVIFAHVANEGQEKKIAEGLVPGYPDYTLDEARGGYFGLRIELKRRKTGSLSKAQKDIGVRLLNNGYVWACCSGWPEAKMIVQWYMGMYKNPVAANLERIPETKRMLNASEE